MLVIPYQRVGNKAMNKHEAYNIVDNEFESFVKGNQSLLDTMGVGEIKPLSESNKGVCCLAILRNPWLITYVGKTEGGEGYMYMFLDERMNKVYSYYDVD